MLLTFKTIKSDQISVYCISGKTKTVSRTKAGRILNFRRKRNHPIEFLVCVDSRRYLYAVWISIILKANYIVNRMLE